MHESNRMRVLATVAVLSLGLMGNRCAGGNGSGGSPPTVRLPGGACVTLASEFPSGFDFLPGSDGHAVVVDVAPAAAIFIDIDGDEPRLLEDDRIEPVPPDSDGDGGADEDQRLCAADTVSSTATPGLALGVDHDLAFVASSGLEQVMFFRAPDGRLVEFDVTNPPDTASYHGEDYPYLPADIDGRTAISTRACVYLTPETGLPDLASTGDAIGQHACCDRVAGVPSYLTSFTAGMALAAGHLFVATSNLDRPEAYRGRFFPGTVLVYDYDPAVDDRAIQPDPDTPLLFTSGFNPTAVASYTTPRGRELILVANSGALIVGVGASNILSESYIDVIDAASRRLVATVPMGFAGLSLEGLAVDPLKRVAFAGSWTLRVVYAIDLRVFDDEDLFTGDHDEVIQLDGSDPAFPDARIFHADAPFEIPDRADGPHPLLCQGWTQTAINAGGDRVYVTERCDGTLSEIELLEPTRSCAAAGSRDECCDEIPLPASCFEVGAVREITDISTASAADHDPSQIRTRPGEPGVDYSGPDVFYIVNSPDGKLCSERIESL